MPKCYRCGKKATVYAGKRWWCEHHYSLLKRKAELYSKRVEMEEEDIPRIDLGLSKV